MSDSSYNPYDLEELKYSGELYHYTYTDACRGIFCHKDCPNYPEDCISLRFKRIDCMIKNDPDERTHITKAVIKIAKKLSKYGKISNDFSKIICDYKPTNKGFYRLAQDKLDYQFYRPQNRLMIDFGPVDYYVACFSTNPYNEHIVKEFKTPIRITFNANFSRMCANPFQELPRVCAGVRLVNFSNDLYPLQCIRRCFPNTYLRRVEYIDTSAGVDEIKSDLIESKLIDIFERSQNKITIEKIHEEIEDLYSLCDAFIKDIRYEPEEEVRFVIQLPEKEYFLKKYEKFPQLLTDNHFVFDEERTYLQLPISDEFVTL